MVVLKCVVVRNRLAKTKNVVEIDKYRNSHEHVKYGYPRQVAHETACACLQLQPASPKLQPTDAASGNDDTVPNHMIKEKLGKYGGSI
jgi:hypothetical protein